MNKRRRLWLRVLQHFFFIAFVILWFKDNFAPLRSFPVPYPFALVPWLALTFFRLYPRLRRSRNLTKRRPSRETAALLLVLLLTVILRLPFLAAPSGLMNSDDAIMTLMGKHIAEGKIPPLCFYGQLRMGSLSSHYYALAFKVFGYSLFVLKWATLLIFLGFMVVQFVFLKEVFSFPLAIAVSFFYSLPIGPLVRAGMDNTSAFALVLLLGSLLLYLSYLIGARSREDLLPAAGLTMGLAFWTHQVTMAFILTSLVILVFRLRGKLRKYATLAYWAFLGFLPQLLVELFFGFRLVPFMTHGERTVSEKSVKAAWRFTADLFSPGNPKAGGAFVLLALAGFFSIIVTAWKKKEARTRIAFALCPPIFYGLYVISDFGTRGVIRYHYPLYVVLPVLFLAVFEFVRPRLRWTLSFGLLLALFFLFNLGPILQLVKSNRRSHLLVTRLVSSMEETGRRYWMGEYWAAYLLTAASGERLIVDAYTFNRYPSYSLAFSNSAEPDNYVFLVRNLPVERKQYAGFTRWLKTLRIKHKFKEVDTARLVYDLETEVVPRVRTMEPPTAIPRLELALVEPRDGYLNTVFRNASPGRLGPAFSLTVEIPGFCDRRERFSPTQPEVKVLIPYPAEASFTIRFSIECAGVKIPSSQREVQYSLPAGVGLGRSDPVVYLRGIRPKGGSRKSPWMACEKEAWLEINLNSPTASRLRFYLDSNFMFRSWQWYGKYSQAIDIAVNDIPLGGRELDDGRNIVDIPLAKECLKPGANLVRLKFRYDLWLSSQLLGRLAAFIQKVEVD